MHSCTHPEIRELRHQLWDRAEALLETVYDPARGPIGSNASHRVARGLPQGGWPILRRGPFLLSTCNEYALLKGQSGGDKQSVTLERAEDLCYRGVVQLKLTNLLVADPGDATRKRVARRLTLMILIFAQRIRKQTYLALSQFFVSSWRQSQRKDGHSEPPKLPTRSRRLLTPNPRLPRWESAARVPCAGSCRPSSIFPVTSCVLDGFCVLRASARLGRALSKKVSGPTCKMPR